MRLTALAAVLATALLPGARATADVEPYVALRLAANDFDGPRYTAGTSLAEFDGNGVMLALGVDGGYLRAEIEFQSHFSHGLSASSAADEIHVNATSVNLILNPMPDSELRPLLGLGVGRARIGVTMTQCYDTTPCPNPPDTHAQRDSYVVQFMGGVAWRPLNSDVEFAYMIRTVGSTELGLTTDAGDPYASAELEMSVQSLEVSWYF